MGSRWIFVCLAVFLGFSVAPSIQQSICKDLDTTACVLLHRQKPDLCTDPAFSGTACKRFCGLCPLVCYDCPSPIKDLKNCNATKACAANETCMLKHFKAFDGHHEYIMTCETKQMCSGFGFGFSAVGKRDSGAKSVESRDISLECCDTDMCNFPTSTTVAPVTTPSTPSTTIRYVHGDVEISAVYNSGEAYTCLQGNKDIILTCTITGAYTSTVKWKKDGDLQATCGTTINNFCVSPSAFNQSRYTFSSLVTAKEFRFHISLTDVDEDSGIYICEHTPHYKTLTIEACGGCSKDVIFLLDDSGSIGLTNFKHAIDFVRTIITSLDIGPHNSQVGLLVFGTHPQSVWHLNSHTTKADLITASGHLHYYGGATRTHEALDYVRTTMLTQAHGDRSAVPNVVVVITDGRSTDRTATAHSAQLLHQISTNVIGIEIANTNEQEILTIATDKNHVFDLQHYSSILTIVPNIINLICPQHP